jgi:hypothetical protein
MVTFKGKLFFSLSLSCSPGWTGICDSYASASLVLGLQVCTTTFGSKVILKISPGLGMVAHIYNLSNMGIRGRKIVILV